jgi:hypothetical protein
MSKNNMFSLTIVVALISLSSVQCADDPGVGGLKFDADGMLSQYNWNDITPNLSVDDVATTGDAACAPFYKSLCSDVRPGTGSVATCIRSQFQSDAVIPG